MSSSSQVLRLLILGSMDEFVELVHRARARGMYTVVCDGYEEGPAKALADVAYTIDIRDTDSLVDLCQREHIDAVLSSFSDILFESSCKLAHAAGLPVTCSLESLCSLRDKSAMKEMFTRLAIESPRSVIVREGFQDTEIAQLRFPCVMKPLDGYGSRGVIVIDSPDEVRCCALSAIAASEEKAVLLESYQDGYEFNMTTWVRNGVVHVISIADREKSVETPGDLPHVSRIVYPSIYFDAVAPGARTIVQRIADYLGIAEGPLSMQFFWTPESGIQVCEVAGRLFGYEHELVELSTGLALEDVLLDSISDPAALQKRLDNHDPSRVLSYACGLYFHAHEVVLGDISFAQNLLQKRGDEFVSLVDGHCYYEEGQTVDHGPGAPPYLARIFLTSCERRTLDDESRRLFAAFKVADTAGNNAVYTNRVATYELSEVREAGQAQ